MCASGISDFLIGIPPPDKDRTHQHPSDELVLLVVLDLGQDCALLFSGTGPFRTLPGVTSSEDLVAGDIGVPLPTADCWAKKKEKECEQIRDIKDKIGINVLTPTTGDDVIDLAVVVVFGS